MQEKHLKRKREEEEKDDSVKEKEISKKVKKSKRDETVFQERLSSLENGFQISRTRCFTSSTKRS